MLLLNSLGHLVSMTVSSSVRLCRHLLPIYILRWQNPRSNTRDTTRKGPLNENQLVGSPRFFAPLSALRRLFISMFPARLGVTDSGDKISIIRLTRLFLCAPRPTDADSQRRLLYHSISYSAGTAASLTNIGFGSSGSGRR